MGHHEVAKFLADFYAQWSYIWLVHNSDYVIMLTMFSWFEVIRVNNMNDLTWAAGLGVGVGSGEDPKREASGKQPKILWTMVLFFL